MGKALGPRQVVEHARGRWAMVGSGRQEQAMELRARWTPPSADLGTADATGAGTGNGFGRRAGLECALEHQGGRERASSRERTLPRSSGYPGQHRPQTKSQLVHQEQGRTEQRTEE